MSDENSFLRTPQNLNKLKHSLTSYLGGSSFFVCLSRKAQQAIFLSTAQNSEEKRNKNKKSTKSIIVYHDGERQKGSSVAFARPSGVSECK
jgi:hypothetical protein